MARRKSLNSAQVKNLINDYSSEARTLEFKLREVSDVLKRLDSELKDALAKEAKKSAPKTKARRGRPARAKAASSTAKAAPKRRGRPKKASSSTVSASVVKKKGPGRPRKAAVAKSSASASATAAPKRRGRPKKVSSSTAAVAVKPAKRGRPKKASASSATSISVGRGRPKKVVTTVASKKPAAKPRPSKAKPSTKGYRLSEWDMMILDALKADSKPHTSDDLLAIAKKKKIGKNDTERKAKITRSIHKLANKRGEIKKLPKPGRGNAYGIK